MARDRWVVEFRLALLLSALTMVLVHPLLDGRKTVATPTAQAGEEAAAASAVDEEEGTEGDGPLGRSGKEALIFQSTGELETVAGTEPPSGTGPLRTFTVKVERGVPVPPAQFARRVTSILGSRRSWSGLEGFSVRRVDDADADLHVILASPDTTDELCRPLKTRGIHSCQRENRAILNALRWLKGADTYGEDLSAYRTYLVNHEVGHVWSHPHLACPAAGKPAPVMVQQTISVEPCTPNPWPLKSEANP